VAFEQNPVLQNLAYGRQQLPQNLPQTGISSLNRKPQSFLQGLGNFFLGEGPKQIYSTPYNANQQQGFKYRGIDQVYGALSPLLASHSLCILPRIIHKDVVERINKNGTALFYTTVTAEFDVVSAIDGSKHTVASFGEAMDSGDKSIGKAMSYAYKAMAFMLFAIPTEGDNDPDANSHEVKPKIETPKTVRATDSQGAKLQEMLLSWCGGDIELAKYNLKVASAFTPKDKEEPVFLSWDKLDTSSAKWVTGVSKKLEEAIGKGEAPANVETDEPF